MFVTSFWIGRLQSSHIFSETEWKAPKKEFSSLSQCNCFRSKRGSFHKRLVAFIFFLFHFSKRSSNWEFLGTFEGDCWLGSKNPTEFNAPNLFKVLCLATLGKKSIMCLQLEHVCRKSTEQNVNKWC